MPLIPVYRNKEPCFCEFLTMAQPDDTRRTTTTDALNIPRPQNSSGSKSSSTQTSPHSWQGGSSNRSSNSSPKPRKSHDHDDHGNHHNKKSVFTKVKEKARKLKKSLSGRRRREENDLHTSTPPSSSGPVEDDENDHSEYFGSPLYEPTVDQHLTKQQHEETIEGSSEKPDMSKDGPPSLCSTDATPTDLTISTRQNTETSNLDAKKPESTLEEKENTRSSSQSVKEYLMHKFEPGDDERALSQKITQTISPKYERMKDTMQSLLRSEEPSESTSKTSNSGLDISPSRSSMESNSLSNHPNLSNSDFSNASNISQCSASSSATGVKDENCQKVLHS
uniref:protein starmaker n=1 Tax=Erigeron canadensis TaxID=72917 RepID=UPI001CB9C605|nr:protein starmaker [Erigeron canadensis]